MKDYTNGMLHTDIAYCVFDVVLPTLWYIKYKSKQEISKDGDLGKGKYEELSWIGGIWSILEASTE